MLTIKGSSLEGTEYDEVRETESLLLRGFSLLCAGKAGRKKLLKTVVGLEVYQGIFLQDGVLSSLDKSMAAIGLWPVVSFSVTMMSLSIQEKARWLALFAILQPQWTKNKSHKFGRLPL